MQPSINNSTTLSDVIVASHYRPSIRPSDLAHGMPKLHEARAKVLAQPAVGVLTVASLGDRRAVEAYAFPIGGDAPLAIVLGRHEACDVGPLPCASLRHALLLAWPWNGEPSLELFDLNTEPGIVLPNGRLIRTALAFEILRFSLGAASVLVAHAAPGQPFLLDADQACDTSTAHRRSEVSVVEASPMQLSARLLGAALAKARDGVANAQAPTLHRSRDDTGRLSIPLPLGDEQVLAGALLGRYDRCELRLTDAANEVSRVHAMIIERRGHLWIVDAASTNGTVVHRRGERIAALGKGRRTCQLDVGDILRIGPCNVMPTRTMPSASA